MPRSTARIVAVASLALVLALSAAGFASAHIPSNSTKEYTACMNSGGGIRLINYENGKRCTASEKKRTWNKKGPTGPQGPIGDTGADGAPGTDGAPGADGAQGPAGVSGYEVVSDDFSMANGVVSGTSTVDCPTGKVPISGGYDYSDLFTKGIDPKWENFVGASYPTATGWTVKWYHNIDNLVINFTVFAACATAS